MTWDVVGFGACSVDYVYRLPAAPSTRGANAKMRIAGRSIMYGGQVATALATCTSLGLKAKYLGVAGSDDNGRHIREALAGAGVDVAETIEREATNQYAVILVDEHGGERIVLWDRDERLALEPEHLSPSLVASTRVVHVDDVDQPAAIRLATLARQAGAHVTSDLDRVTSLTAALADAVTVPIFAEHVPEALTGEPDFEGALRRLQRPHHRMLCVTLGDHGAVAFAGDRLYHEPAFTVETVDTTGAGDVFRGALILALLRGDSVPELLRYANAAAAISCTRLGAMNGVPARDEVDALLGQVSR